MQFLVQLKGDLAPHWLFIKFFSIKVVVFCFWQDWLIAFPTSDDGPPKPTKFVAGSDLRIGIPCILICVELPMFAILRSWAFPWKPYEICGLPKQSALHYARRPSQALLEAIYPWNYVNATARGLWWLFYGLHFRTDDSSYYTQPKPVISGRLSTRTDPTHDRLTTRQGKERKIM